MLDFIKDFISSYGTEIIMTIFTAIATFLGNKIKTIYENKVQDETKKKVIEDTCKCVEQIYKDTKGEEKFNIAVQKATEILNNKGITITDLEIKVLIESVCNDFSNAIKSEESSAESIAETDKSIAEE